MVSLVSPLPCPLTEPASTPGKNAWLVTLQYLWATAPALTCAKDALLLLHHHRAKDALLLLHHHSARGYAPPVESTLFTLCWEVRGIFLSWATPE